MPIEIRAVEPAELPALLRADELGFSGEPHEPGAPTSWAEGELDRTRVAFEDGRMVGVSRAYSFELTMPGGGLLPAAAVSWVSVLPTHRRRGILRSMIDALHADARDRGEPAAILTASESVIYGRFGYGIATWRFGLSARRSRVGFAATDTDRGQMRLIERAEAETVLPEIYDRARRARAGMVSRPDFWWPSVFWEYLAGPKKAFFVAVHTNEHGVDDGFVGYEVSGDWTGGLPDRNMIIVDMQAVDGPARIALWRYVFGVDLIDNVAIRGAPVDDPLRHIVTDPRRVRVDYVNDGLYLAPLDIAAVMGAREYAVPGRLVLEVHDPSGGVTTLALDADGGGTHCKLTTESPDLVCRSDVLGMAMLGGTRWSELAAAGRLDVERDVLPLADAMFMCTPAAALLSGF